MAVWHVFLALRNGERYTIDRYCGEVRPVKRILALAVLAALLFTGCAGKTSEKKTVTVGLVETEGCQIEENARQVVPGGNVSFTVTMDAGFALAGVDYDGEYAIWNSDGKLRLELKNVRYPGRYHLRLSKTDSTILFEPNGGQGEALTVTRDLSYHVRPNTAPVAFDRPGYSLVAWNTEPDGSGEQIGLGSRITNPDSGKLTLYAQWAAWSSESDFQAENGKILAYTGSEERIVIPESIGGETVTAIAEGAFTDCAAESIIFPKTLETVEAGAFRNCALRELTFYDSIRFLPSDAFRDCENFSTLHINAQRPPYGSHYRRESLLADKLDLLILNQGKQKIVFYGGCSMWYNLDGPVMRDAVSPDYQVVNVAVNGLINSAVQMQIITALLEEGDIFFHTPELSSEQQMLCQMEKQGEGSILNVASSAGLFPAGPYMATYYATKSYVTSLTRAVALELKEKKSNVYVGVLCPGPVDTEFNKVANVEFAIPSITPTYCAAYAIRKMEKRKIVIVPKNKMKVLAFISRVLPQSLVIRMTARQQKKKRSW